MRHSWLMAVALGAGGGCASLLGVEELPGADGGADGGAVATFEVRVTVLRDGVAANGVDIVGHGPDGEVADQGVTVGGVVSVEIPTGGMVSALVELEPARFALRTWTDLEAGDELAIDIGSGTVPLTEATIQFDTAPPGAPDRFEHRFRCGGPTASGAIGVPPSMQQSLQRSCIGADGTLDIVARVAQNDDITGIASATGIDPEGMSDEGDGGIVIALPAWTSSMELSTIVVEGTEGLPGFRFGEYRNGSFFSTTIGRNGSLFGVPVLRFGRPFAELVAVVVDDLFGNEGGESPQLAFFSDPGADSMTVDANLLAIDDFASAETAREPRPAVTWTLSGDSVELDAVLFSIELFDLASPSKTLTWHVISPPARGRIELPDFPDGLVAQPAEFQGWDAGTAAAFASSDFAGYRALRAGGGLTGIMGLEPPAQQRAGTLRIYRESLVPP